MKYTAKNLREALLSACLTEHQLTVKSIGDERRITEYFHGIGWTWAVKENFPDGIYDDEIRRRGGRSAPLNWCGMGIGFVGVHLVGNHIVGGQCIDVRLKPGIARHVLPSTMRLQDLRRWEQAGVRPPEKVQAPQRGDIITVYTTGVRGDAGDHYAVVVEVEGDTLHTVEFNATGELGDGTRGRGVVRRTRRVQDVRQICRLEDIHFEGMQ